MAEGVVSSSEASQDDVDDDRHADSCNSGICVEGDKLTRRAVHSTSLVAEELIAIVVVWLIMLLWLVTVISGSGTAAAAAVCDEVDARGDDSRTAPFSPPRLLCRINVLAATEAGGA